MHYLFIVVAFYSAEFAVLLKFAGPPIKVHES